MNKNLAKDLAKRLNLSDLYPVKDIHPYDNITTLMKNGALAQVITLSGKSFAGLTDEERATLYKFRVNFLKDMEAHFKVKIIYDRKRAKAKQHDIDFNNPFVKELYDVHHSKFKESFSNKIYCMVTLEVKLPSNKDMAIEQLTKAVEELSAKTRHIIAVLSRYDAAYLKNSDNDPALLEFWSERINFGNKVTLPLHSQEAIFNTLTLTDILFNEETGVITLTDGRHKEYAAVLRINTLPELTSQDMLGFLAQSRHTFSIVQNIQLIDDEKLKSKWIREANTLNSMGVGGIGQFIGGKQIFGPKAQQLEMCTQALADGDTRFLNHQFMIIVRAPAEEALEIAIDDIIGRLAPSGIHARKETQNLENAFWSQYPTLEELNTTRENIISIHDAANFISLSTDSEGSSKCAFGNRPVATFLTAGGTPYNFTFHDGEDPETHGSTVVVGPTGCGKTTFIMLLGALCMPFGGNDTYGESPFRFLAFDNGFGVKSQIKCFNGQYIDMGNPDNLPMNPFLLKKTPDNLKFLTDWIEGIISSNGDPLTSREQTTIEKWINENMELPKEDRTFETATEVIRSLEYPEGETTLMERLQKWVPNSENPKASPINSKYFNAPKDALAFDSQMVGFEMGSLLKNNPDMVPAIFGYINHCFMQSVKAKPGPHMMFVDEMKTYLANKVGAEFIEENILKMRKLSGIMVLAGQSPAHILECEHDGKDFGKSILENIATKIIFPNIDADPEAYAAFGLNAAEIKWVQDSQGKRQVLIKKRGEQGVILNIDLKYYGKYLHLISGNPQDSKQLERLMKEFPDDYEKAIERFLDIKHKRFMDRH